MHLGHPCPKPYGRRNRANRLSCRFVLLPGRNDGLCFNDLPHNENCWSIIANNSLGSPPSIDLIRYSGGLRRQSNLQLQRLDDLLHCLPFRFDLAGQGFVKAFPVQPGFLGKLGDTAPMHDDVAQGGDEQARVFVHEGLGQVFAHVGLVKQVVEWVVKFGFGFHGTTLTGLCSFPSSGLGTRPLKLCFPSQGKLELEKARVPKQELGNQ